ncbi:MAG: metallophosphoesterase [Ilumatobacteraceae bacterium]
MPVELTTVADDAATFHDGPTVDRVDGLEPGTEHERHGIPFRTLERPTGVLRCRFGTVNDVHFGETEAGRVDELTEGPVLRAPPGAPPYPETMNHGAVGEMRVAELAAVVVKGDLTSDGTDAEFDAFEACYRPVFGERLHVVRGNHDAYRGQADYAGDEWIELPGVAIALLDTAIPTKTSGRLTPAQLDWLDAGAAASTVPVVAMGHHQQWVGGERSPEYFGIDPESSDGLTDVMVRRPAIVAYTAGHTHRHRVRRVGPGLASIEVGCVKDFPGTWAEYRVYDGGILQVVHRISTPDALAWSESCRVLYSDFGVDYASYAMGGLDDRCFAIPFR